MVRGSPREINFLVSDRPERAYIFSPGMQVNRGREGSPGEDASSHGADPAEILDQQKEMQRVRRGSDEAEMRVE